MIDRFDGLAKRTGACLVPSCGYDSIPSDLGTLYAVSAVRSLVGATAPPAVDSVTVYQVHHAAARTQARPLTRGRPGWPAAGSAAVRCRRG